MPDAGEPPAHRPWVSVVVPVFDEEESLPELYGRLRTVLDSVPESSEIVFVNDGSTDGSGDVLDKIVKSDPRVIVVDLAYNAGQHAALLAGLQVSRGGVVVTLDADLQNPPEEVPKLLAKIREGFEVVGGVRQVRNDILVRRALSALVRRVANGATDYGCMLRAYRRDVVQRILRCRERSVFLPALAISLARRVPEVPVAHDRRRFGRSRSSTFRLIRLGFDWLTGFSVLPIQIVSLLGVATAIIGLVFGGLLFARSLYLGAEANELSVLFAMLFVLFGGVLIAIGVVGEYVARIYMEVRRRPLYTIDSVRRSPLSERP